MPLACQVIYLLLCTPQCYTLPILFLPCFYQAPAYRCVSSTCFTYRFCNRCGDPRGRWAGCTHDFDLAFADKIHEGALLLYFCAQRSMYNDQTRPNDIRMLCLLHFEHGSSFCLMHCSCDDGKRNGFEPNQRHARRHAGSRKCSQNARRHAGSRECEIADAECHSLGQELVAQCFQCSSRVFAWTYGAILAVWIYLDYCCRVHRLLVDRECAQQDALGVISSQFPKTWSVAHFLNSIDFKKVVTEYHN